MVGAQLEEPIRLITMRHDHEVKTCSCILHSGLHIHGRRPSSDPLIKPSPTAGAVGVGGRGIVTASSYIAVSDIWPRIRAGNMDGHWLQGRTNRGKTSTNKCLEAGPSFTLHSRFHAKERSIAVFNSDELQRKFERKGGGCRSPIAPAGTSQGKVLIPARRIP